MLIKVQNQISYPHFIENLIYMPIQLEGKNLPLSNEKPSHTESNDLFAINHSEYVVVSESKLVCICVDSAFDASLIVDVRVFSLVCLLLSFYIVVFVGIIIIFFIQCDGGVNLNAYMRSHKNPINFAHSNGYHHKYPGWFTGYSLGEC